MREHGPAAALPVADRDLLFSVLRAHFDLAQGLMLLLDVLEDPDSKIKKSGMRIAVQTQLRLLQHVGSGLTSLVGLTPEQVMDILNTPEKGLEEVDQCQSKPH